jgi:hypothetical protein
MRALAILLVACSSSSSPAPAADLALAARCPVGDGTHVEVYGFLERALAEAGGQRAEAKERLAHERELEKDPKNSKPQRASVAERELSHVLTTLCAGTPGCRAIGLYDKGGIAIALSSHRDVLAPLGFADDTRWSKLSSAASGTRFELAAGEGTGVWIVFPTSSGLAACIVEK